MRLEALTGAKIAAVLDDVADLRVRVFAEWPYLYDGDRDYEMQYLQTYRDAPGAVVVAAYDGQRVVGASTGTPLEHHADDFAAAFADTGIDLSRLFYCAESVLLPDWRGRGLGHDFFDLRERHARALGFDKCCFCAVLRPDDHPARPAGYRPLDGFWRGRGYVPLDGVTARFHWRDLGQAQESAKSLQFWIRDL